MEQASEPRLNFWNLLLQARGIPCVHFRNFPRYESSFGRLVARFLNREFGKLDEVDPHLSAAALCRRPFRGQAFVTSGVDGRQERIIVDRYIASNLAHQAARVAADRRAEFLAWLRQLEYGTYGLPTEDLVIFLRRTPAEAQQMVGRKAARNYTESKHDLQESDLSRTWSRLLWSMTNWPAGPLG